MGQKDNCPQANLIEIAAYAYDLGNEPFKNSSLLREFDTRLVASKYECCLTYYFVAYLLILAGRSNLHLTN